MSFLIDLIKIGLAIACASVGGEGGHDAHAKLWCKSCQGRTGQAKARHVSF